MSPATLQLPGTCGESVGSTGSELSLCEKVTLIVAPLLRATELEVVRVTVNGVFGLEVVVVDGTTLATPSTDFGLPNIIKNEVPIPKRTNIDSTIIHIFFAVELLLCFANLPRLKPFFCTF